MMQLKGTATISEGNKTYEVSVLFDLENGRCLISKKNAEASNSSFAFLLATGHILLQDIVITHGNHNLIAKELGPFQLYSYNQAVRSEDNSIANSSLAVILGIESDSKEVNEIELKPLSSKILFQSDKTDLDKGSEILFHCDPRRTFDFSINLDGEEVRIHTFEYGTLLNKYVRCVSSKINLTKYLDNLQVALSLFLRRKAFVHFIRNHSEISINLIPPNQVLSYGPLISNPSLYKQIFQKLVTNPLRPRKHFLIEAFSNPGTIDIRLLNAFVHLEILDGGKTLSPDRVASVLKISRENADALVKMRNILIHNGLGVKEALEKTRLDLKSRQGGKKTAAVIEKVFESNSPQGYFYAALMDIFSKQLVRELGISEDAVQSRVPLLF